MRLQRKRVACEAGVSPTQWRARNSRRLENLRIPTRTTCSWLLAMVVAPAALGRGVSPYLPLNLEPEIERRIERVLMLADDAVLTRPIPAARVLDALPRACAVDAVLCRQVRRYLARYMHGSGITRLAVEGAATSGAERTVPNRYGMGSESAWQASVGGYWQPSDYALLSVGGVAYDGNEAPAGSVLSLGIGRAQLDVGYRNHWLSPFTDSSMLLGTEALTMPSVTLSSYEPLTRFGLRYEAFLAEMSESDRIEFQGRFTSGKPRLAGLHVSAQPVRGWSLGVNRILQYGGGERGGDSFGDLLDAFFRPADADNVSSGSIDDQFGNQLASITSRFLFPGKLPFAVYLEYAGEDTSRGRNYLLGNSALLAGIHVPRFAGRFDFTYEAAEWQNGWYVNGLYGDGLTNEGRVLGHWAGDARIAGDAVGAQSHMARLGWEPEFGGRFELTYRTLVNESYSAAAYRQAHDFTVRYARSLRELTVGAEVFAGRDVFGEDFSRAALFFIYAPDAGGASGIFDEPERTVSAGEASMFVDVGLNHYEVSADLEAGTPRVETDREWSPHFAIGARREVLGHSELGVRLEVDEIDDEILLAVRAVDYRYRLRRNLAVGAFLGAARYDLDTPAYGLYAGIGAEWRDVLPGWSVGVDLRRAFEVARDDLVPSDPQGGRPDSFYDITAATLSISRRF
jgi:hypothetical protein